MHVTDMSFEMTTVVEEKFLRITTVGTFAFDDLFPFLDQVKTCGETSGRDKVLIDSRQLEGRMTEAERFQGGQRIAEIFGSRTKLALLMPSDMITKLGELAARNRGARLLVSASEAEAVNWLLGV